MLGEGLEVERWMPFSELRKSWNIRKKNLFKRNPERKELPQGWSTKRNGILKSV